MEPSVAGFLEYPSVSRDFVPNPVIASDPAHRPNVPVGVSAAGRMMTSGLIIAFHASDTCRLSHA
jgi:hypothetical protein